MIIYSDVRDRDLVFVQHMYTKNEREPVDLAEKISPVAMNPPFSLRSLTGTINSQLDSSHPVLASRGPKERICLSNSYLFVLELQYYIRRLPSSVTTTE
jgi:hypothetical protein